MGNCPLKVGGLIVKGYQSPELKLTLMASDDVVLASSVVSTYDNVWGEHIDDDREW